MSNKPQAVTETIVLKDGREVTIETGKLAKQADGAIAPLFTALNVQPKQLESVETIVAKIRKLEDLSEGMMKEILEGLYE